jgi:hypothetical protein
MVHISKTGIIGLCDSEILLIVTFIMINESTLNAVLTGI